MNIYDYTLEKLAEKNNRLTDPLIIFFRNSKNILNANNDQIVKILSSTRINENSIVKFLKNKMRFNQSPEEFLTQYNLEANNIMEKFNVKIISFSDEEYPPQLKKIKEIPLNLYVRGKIEFSYEKSVAIVGTRKLTTYAKQKVREIAFDLAKKGFCIISGLARGTDTEAHTSSIMARGKTIAILPYLSPVYPPENEPLVKEILEMGGAIISENLKGEYNPSLFTQRNRIISGLSKGTFIVEGSEKSGSFSQYNHAHRQHKIIFSLRPISQHEGDFLPRLIFAKEGKWVTSSEEVIKLIEKID